MTERITGTEAAEIAAVAGSTWRAYVARGQAPKPVDRIGREPLYDRAEIEAWAAARPGRGARTDLRKDAMITAADIRQHVIQALAEHVHDFDVDALTAELVQAYDLTGPAPKLSVDDIEHAEFWAVVAKHDRG